MIVARDIMTRNVITVSMDMDLGRAALIFTSHRITGAPVVDSDSMLVGVISSRDIVRHAARMLPSFGPADGLSRAELSTLHELRNDFEAQRGASVKVMDVMTPYAVSASEDTSAVELAQIMCRERVHRVLILSDGRLTGIVSSLDIVRAVANSGLGDLMRDMPSDRRMLRRAVRRQGARTAASRPASLQPGYRSTAPRRSTSRERRPGRARPPGTARAGRAPARSTRAGSRSTAPRSHG